MTVRLHRITTLTTVLIMVLAGLLGGSTAAAAPAPHRLRAQVRVQPEFRRAHQIADGLFSCQSPSSSFRCYGPDQIRRAYDVDRALAAGTTGRGRTIVIIDAYGYPTVTEDLHAFDTAFGLSDPTLNQIYPDGRPTFDPADPVQVGWSGEIALDVQWAHVIAPDATIDLVVARSSEDTDILSATRYAIAHNLGDVISQSYGEAEQCVDPRVARVQHRLFAEATRKGITLISSAADQGAAQYSCDGSGFVLAVSSPASDPYVLGIGGTHLDADPVTGDYHGETVWNEGDLGTGGGFSVQFARPFYQAGVAGIGRRRGVPDVSYSAAGNGGVLVAWSAGDPAAVGDFYVFYGTSAGSPQWAGITALADQRARRRLGWLNPTIYLVARSPLYARTFHDVTSGDNTFVGTDASGNAVTVTGYAAGRGWDPATGWGSPDVARLLTAIAGGGLPLD